MIDFAAGSVDESLQVREETWEERNNRHANLGIPYNSSFVPGQSLIGSVKQSAFYYPKTHKHTACNGFSNHMKMLFLGRKSIWSPSCIPQTAVLSESGLSNCGAVSTSNNFLNLLPMMYLAFESSNVLSSVPHVQIA
ncbi:hypothetical protein QQP08_017548, partial [Theobroma cacao]